MKARTSGKEVSKIDPWYKDFTGQIKVVDRRKKKVKAGNITLNVEAEKSGDDDEKSRSKYSIVTYGSFTIEQGGKVVITELPIGSWTKPYFQWLKSMEINKEITKVKNLSDDDKVYFEIYGFKNPTYKTLKLKKSRGLTNMVCLDIDGTPVHYENTDAILEEFYNQRIKFYDIRKKHMIKVIEEEIIEKELKIRFIKAVRDGQIIVMNQKKSVVLEQMRALQFPDELLSKTSIVRLTQDDIEKLENEIAKIKRDKEELEGKEINKIWYDELCVLEYEYKKHNKMIKGPVIQVVDEQVEEEEENSDEDSDSENPRKKKRKPASKPVTKPVLKPVAAGAKSGLRIKVA